MAKPADSRERLLETTAELLQRQGYAATGLAQIVEDSGAPRGSLYFLFPGGKEELAAQALERASAALDARLAPVLAAAPDAAHVIGELAAFFGRELTGSQFTKGCPFATVALEQSPTSDALHRVCSAAYTRWQASLAARLRHEGHSRARADSLASFCLSAIEGALVLCRAHRSLEPLQRTAAELRRVLKGSP